MDENRPAPRLSRGRQLSSEVITQRVVCVDCHREFDARVRIILGVRMVAKGCPECSEKHITAFYQAEKARKQAEETETRRNWLYASGVPAHYQGNGFEQFDRSAQPKAFDACREYAKGLTRESIKGYHSLVLISPFKSVAEPGNGLGKTHLVCAIAQHLIATWTIGGMRPVTVTTEPDLFARIQATFNAPKWDNDPSVPPRETETGIINLLCRVPVLVLDDLGKVERSDPRFVQRTLFAIINGRYNNKLPIVVTANMTIEQMRDYLGGESNQASLDRILEMCRGKIIQMAGKSWRRK